MSGLLEKLSTINTFFKAFSISRKFLVFIVILMLVQSLAEVFSAMLLIPFLNSLQNIDNTSTDINIFIKYMNILFSGYDQEYKFVYIYMYIFVHMCMHVHVQHIHAIMKICANIDKFVHVPT